MNMLPLRVDGVEIGGGVRMNGWLIAGTVLASIGLVVVLAGGRGQNRLPRPGTVTGPADIEPPRGWLEWLGFGLTVGGFVMGVVGLFLG